MNLPLVSKLLGVVAFLIGATMIFSLPWAHPGLGRRADPDLAAQSFETGGFILEMQRLLKRMDTLSSSTAWQTS